jgi:ribosomal-protein-alanine N-acetyltransferase
MILNIRRMKQTDIDAVYFIEMDVHKAPWSKEILRDCVLVGYDCRLLEMKNGEHLIPGGYIISRLSDQSCHILNFCIASPLQSKGFGRKLLQSLLFSLSTCSHIKNVLLEVRPSNAQAIHLYSSLGFEQVDVKKDYYKDIHGIEDALIFQKML